MKAYNVIGVRSRCEAAVGLASNGKLIMSLLILTVLITPICAGASEKLDVRREEFTLKRASRVVPSSLSKLIKFEAWGGGGEDPISPFSSILHPGMPQMGKNRFEAFEPINICPGDQYTGDEFRLVRPDGSVHLLQSAEGSCPMLRVPIDGPFGNYTVIMTSGSQTYRLSLSIVPPDGPRVGRVRSGLFLYGFDQSERVRVAIYDWDDDGALRFKAWQDFVVDDDGRLLVGLPPDWQKQRIICVAIGDSSGEASYPGKRNTSAENRIKE